MRLKFAITKSKKVDSPLRVYHVADEINVGDELFGQEVVQTFCHEERLASRYLPTRPRSDRGDKELRLLVEVMEFSRSGGQTKASELERLLTSAFHAGMQSCK